MVTPLLDAQRAIRESDLDYARGALLMATFSGAISFEDYVRLDRELREAADLASATRH